MRYNAERRNESLKNLALRRTVKAECRSYFRVEFGCTTALALMGSQDRALYRKSQNRAKTFFQSAGEEVRLHWLKNNKTPASLTWDKEVMMDSGPLVAGLDHWVQS